MTSALYTAKTHRTIQQVEDSESQRRLMDMHYTAENHRGLCSEDPLVGVDKVGVPGTRMKRTSARSRNVGLLLAVKKRKSCYYYNYFSQE